LGSECEKEEDEMEGMFLSLPHAKSSYYIEILKNKHKKTKFGL
jgi:hypothetical protein